MGELICRPTVPMELIAAAVKRVDECGKHICTSICICSSVMEDLTNVKLYLQALKAL